LATKANPYASLIGSSGTLHFAGIDQGIDFTGAGPVYALDRGTITRVEKGGTGWPGQGALVVERLTSGPASGLSVYYAEDLSPAANIAVGNQIAKGDPIAYATGSGQAPGIEVGFAQPSGIPLAPLPPPRPASQFTQQGAGFLSFVENPALAGAKPSSGGSSWFSQFLGGLNPLNIASNTGTAIQGAENVAAAPISLFNSATSFFSWIGDPKNLIRVGEMIAGGALFLASVGIIGAGAVRSTQSNVRSAVR